MTPGEIIANALNLVCILLAGRNSVHTWWTGILGCLAFGWVFCEAKLYADVTLQLFFIATGILGWWNWMHGMDGSEKHIRKTDARWLASCAVMAVLAAAGYGWVLHRFTDAWAPFLDSLVLVFSVMAQLLLMGRRVENWPCWLLVNTLSVPLYYSRELYLTAGLYVLFWVNALWSWRHWHELWKGQPATETQAVAGA